MKNYVIINGVNSNTITGLMINELPPITKPQMRAIQEEIDGRDGDITTNLGYSAYDKTITIGLFGTGYDIDDIVAFFNGEGTIVFSNEDDKYYNFKILNQIDYVSLQKFKSASITFHCQPFKYPLTETPLEIEYSYVSDEGEFISLNTAPGLMKVNLLGNTSQTGTPTPSSPIPVNVVSGDNEVVVCGKNYFVKSSVIEDEKYLDNGTISTDSSYCRSPLYMNVNGVAKLTISGSDSSSNGKVIIYDENKNAIDYWSTRNRTIDMPNNSYYIRISVEKAYKDTLQVEVGDTATSYSDESSTYPIHLGTYELCKIGTYQDKFIRNSGKNMCFNTTKPANANLKFFIDKPSQTFTISFTTNEALSNNSLYLEVDGTGYGNLGGITASANTIATKTYTLTDTQIQAIQNGTNIDLLLYKNGANFTIPTDAMVNEGSTALPYEPYGNGDWYLEKEILRKDLGELNWLYGEGRFYSNDLRYTINKNQGGSVVPNNILCENYTVITPATWYAKSTIGISVGGSGYGNDGSILVYNSNYTDTTTFKNAMSGNYVYCTLISPTYTKIEGTLKDELDEVYRASSFEGTTNISQNNNDKAFILNVVAMEEGSNEVQVNNIGNTYSKPLIALEGTGNINIYLDNTQILQANVEDKMNIDIAKLEAYKPDTSVLLNRQVIGNYNSMTIPSGTSIIRMDGELIKATITNYTRWL